MVTSLQRDGARYRIGPLTTYADADELRQWHLVAEPGEEMVYAIGPALGARAATPKLAREISERGEGLLFQRRESGGIHYVIRKREVRPAKALSASVSDAWAGKPEGRILAAVCEIADMGLPMPLYDVLAEACGLADGEAVRYRLNVLAKAGVLRLAGPSGDRVVEICATGQRTARCTARGVGR